MKKKLGILIVVLAVAGGGAYYYFTYGQPKEKPQVVQAAITQGDIVESVQATGTLDAWRTVSVGSQVSGVVSEIDADYNSIVKKGQVIAKLDPSLLQVQVDIAQANVERQQGQIQAAQVNLENAQRQLARIQGLFDKQLENQQDLDAATLTVKSDETALEAAKKQLVQDEATLDQAKLNVSYTIITAPIDGVVVARNVDVGQTVQQSMSVATFFTIARDLTDLELTAGVDEADIGKILPHMPVTFTVDSYQNEVFKGTVDSVRLNATTTNNVVTYPVWIDAPNPDLKLRPSMTATVKIIVSTAENAIRIPNQAVRFRPTNDMYTSLGLTPPAPTGRRGRGAGAGGRGGPNGRGANANAGAGAAEPTDQAAANAPQPSGAQAATGTNGQGAAAGEGGQGANGRQGGGRFANMTPEQRAAMRAQFEANGGRGGRGFGQGQGNLTPEQRQQMAGRFGGRGGNANNGLNGVQAANEGKPIELKGGKIDDLYPALMRQVSPGTVYTWDGTKLNEVRVRTGISDGQYTELVSGDLKVGDQVVTGIVIPVSQEQRNQQNQNLFGGGGRGPGGLFPGGGGGGRGR